MTKLIFTRTGKKKKKLSGTELKNLRMVTELAKENDFIKKGGNHMARQSR